MKRLLLILVLMLPSTVSGECIRMPSQPTLGDYLANRTSDGRYIHKINGKKSADWSIRKDFNRLLDVGAAFFPKNGVPICPPRNFLPKERSGRNTNCRRWEKWMKDVPDIGHEILQDYLDQNGHKHSSGERLETVLISALQDKWPCGEKI